MKKEYVAPQSKVFGFKVKKSILQTSEVEMDGKTDTYDVKEQHDIDWWPSYNSMNDKW